MEKKKSNSKKAVKRVPKNSTENELDKTKKYKINAILQKIITRITFIKNQK